MINGKSILDGINRFFGWAEKRGWIAPLPTFLEDYADYPAFRALEAAWPDIREECEWLMERRDGLTDISVLGGDYTSKGIHTIAWKSFMLVAGGPVESNAALCPKTAACLAGIPDVYIAFFSILEPHQYVKPHWGYYKGILRYHLPVIIPDDNREQKCWLRINDDLDDNARRDKSLIERGRRYFWKNGKGVFFDDTKLHDAANESDAVRVVLWVDLRRRLPWWLDAVNRAMLWLVLRSSFIGKVRDRSRLDPEALLPGGKRAPAVAP